jgi:hypothetical protein
MARVDHVVTVNGKEYKLHELTPNDFVALANRLQFARYRALKEFGEASQELLDETLKECSAKELRLPEVNPGLDPVFSAWLSLQHNHPSLTLKEVSTQFSWEEIGDIILLVFPAAKKNKELNDQILKLAEEEKLILIEEKQRELASRQAKLAEQLLETGSNNSSTLLENQA